MGEKCKLKSKKLFLGEDIRQKEKQIGTPQGTKDGPATGKEAFVLFSNFSQNSTPEITPLLIASWSRTSSHVDQLIDLVYRTLVFRKCY